MERGALFRHFASPRWSPLRMRTKVVSLFIFFQEISNKKFKALRPKMTKIASRWGPALIKAAPPLVLSSWSFLTFVHHGIDEVEKHLLWKFHKKIHRKSWPNVQPKLLACLRFLCKVVHKISRLKSSIALGRLNLTFLPLGLSLWNLAHLFIMFLATKRCIRFNFCPGT